MESQICWIFGTSWPCLTPSEWAAWAQATAASIGIGLAIAVPAWQRWRQVQDQRIDRDNLKRSMAGALLAGVDDVKATAIHLRGRLERDDYEAEVLAYADDSFTPYAEFNQFRTNFHILGTLGAHLNLLLTNAAVVKNIVTEAKRMKYLTEQERDEAKEELDHLIAISINCSDALATIIEFRRKGPLGLPKAGHL